MDWKQFEIAPKKLRTTNITSFAERQARKLEKINQKIMTLEEAIEHCEKVADSTCGLCSDNHRQLAEWLRDYHRLLHKMG